MSGEVRLSHSENFSLTASLTQKVYDINNSKSKFGPIVARVVGLGSIGTGLFDTCAHFCFFTSKTLASLVVTPYNALADCFFSEKAAPRDLEFSSAWMNLIGVVQNLFITTILLPIACLLSPDRAYQWFAHHRKNQQALEQAEKLEQAIKLAKQVGQLKEKNKMLNQKIQQKQTIAQLVKPDDPLIKKLEKENAELNRQLKEYEEKTSSLQQNPPNVISINPVIKNADSKNAVNQKEVSQHKLQEELNAYKLTEKKLKDQIEDLLKQQEAGKDKQATDSEDKPVSLSEGKTKEIEKEMELKLEELHKVLEEEEKAKKALLKQQAQQDGSSGKQKPDSQKDVQKVPPPPPPPPFTTMSNKNPKPLPKVKPVAVNKNEPKVEDAAAALENSENFEEVITSFASIVKEESLGKNNAEFIDNLSPKKKPMSFKLLKDISLTNSKKMNNLTESTHGMYALTEKDSKALKDIETKEGLIKGKMISKLTTSLSEVIDHYTCLQLEIEKEIQKGNDTSGILLTKIQDRLSRSQIEITEQLLIDIDVLTPDDLITLIDYLKCFYGKLQELKSKDAQQDREKSNKDLLAKDAELVESNKQAILAKLNLKKEMFIDQLRFMSKDQIDLSTLTRTKQLQLKNRFAIENDSLAHNVKFNNFEDFQKKHQEMIVFITEMQDANSIDSAKFNIIKLMIENLKNEAGESAVREN